MELANFLGSLLTGVGGTGGTGKVAAAGTGTGRELSAGTGAAGPDSAAPVSCDIAAAAGSSLRSNLPTSGPLCLLNLQLIAFSPSLTLTVPTLMGRSHLQTRFQIMHSTGSLA